MARPTTYPEWATLDAVDPTSGQNNVVEPPAAWKDYGWSYQEKPPRNYDNWFKRTTHDWVQYLDQVCSRPATVVIAASNASTESKAHADYVCDGTNDEVELQDALDEVGLTGGTLMLTEGVFHVSGQLTLVGKHHVQVCGRGPGASLLRVADAVASSFRVLVFESCNYTTLRDFGIDGNSAGHAKVHTGVYFDGGAAPFVLHVRATGFSSGNDGGIDYGMAIECEATSQVRVIASSLAWVHLTAGSDNAQLIGCRLAMSPQYGVAIVGNRALISDCVIDSNANTGILISGDYCTISSSIVRLCGGHGISISGVHGAVQGCTVDNCELHGISAAGLDDGLISGNRVYNNSLDTDDTYSGIYIDNTGSKNVVSNNIIRTGGLNQHRYGIECTDATTLVEGNDARLSGKTGMVSGGLIFLSGGLQVWDPGGAGSWVTITKDLVNLT